MTWLIFTLIAMTASGIFGVLTHTGQRAMGDSANGQYKALLFAGVPLVNAVVALAIDTPQTGGLRRQFIVGLQLAIFGSCMIMIYRPGM